jgi:hypothetical protein
VIVDALLEAAIEPLPAPANPPVVLTAGVLPGEREDRPSRATVARVVDAASILVGRWGAFQRCVERRESNGRPHVVNSSGHAGLYQFSTSWRHGLPYVVQRALVRAGLPTREARAIRLSLPHRIERWPARMQRVGFAGVIHEGGTGAALRHWSLAGSPCNALAR